jgi:hypothetical protein
MSPFHDQPTGYRAYDPRVRGHDWRIDLNHEYYFAAKAVLAGSDAADAARDLEIAPNYAKGFYALRYLVAAARVRINNRLARESADYAQLVERYNALYAPDELSQTLGNVALTQSVEADTSLPSDTDSLDYPGQPPQDEDPIL